MGQRILITHFIVTWNWSNTREHCSSQKRYNFFFPQPHQTSITENVRNFFPPYKSKEIIVKHYLQEKIASYCFPPYKSKEIIVNHYFQE